MRYAGLSLAFAVLALPGLAFATTESEAPTTITGQYVEVRTCDVYTGPCFANSEMGLVGKEAILTWAVDEGTWDGVRLDGLKVVAAIKTDATLGDIRAHTGRSEAALIVDATADEAQKKALVSFAKAMGGKLLDKVVAVESAAIETNVGQCSEGGCAFVKADGLVEIETRCLGGADHVCGNEETYYPPLTSVENASPAFTEKAKFNGKALGVTWQNVGSRGAFLATFAA